MRPVFLVLNSGSSSLKFQLFDVQGVGEPRGLYEGLDGKARFSVKHAAGGNAGQSSFEGEAGFGHERALDHLASWLRQHSEGLELAAVGHRVVHGGSTYSGPVRIDEHVVAALEKLVPLAPLHQPHNLTPIRILQRQFPKLDQIACFDTGFHHSQPEIARLFALPRAISDAGVKRYGFHGLSYAYLATVFESYDPALARGRVIAAHLGNGASLCAIRAGKSIATTMGFSALDGLPMGTRCGNLDAAVVFHLMREMKLELQEAEKLLYTKSGLLGVSGISNDMRELRKLAGSNAAAREAIDLFVYRIGREIGSLIAALGGIDAFVFTAGIGENDKATRAEVLHGATWAGFELDDAANNRGGPRISRGNGPSAWVIPTDEEVMIVRDMRRLLGKAGPTV